MIKVAVFGSAQSSGDASIENIIVNLSHDLSSHYGEHLTILTGACSGYPDIFAKTAQRNGSKIIGYSPRASQHDHNLVADDIENNGEKLVHSDYFDEIKLGGSSSHGRNLTNRSMNMINEADMGIFLGGRDGTMTEYLIARDDSNLPLYLVKGTGGIVDSHSLISPNFKEREAKEMYATQDVISEDIKRDFPLHKIEDNLIFSKNMDRLRAKIGYTFATLTLLSIVVASQFVE